jgi:hypothetical protein
MNDAQCRRFSAVTAAVADLVTDAYIPVAVEANVGSTVATFVVTVTIDDDFVVDREGGWLFGVDGIRDGFSTDDVDRARLVGLSGMRPDEAVVIAKTGAAYGGRYEA